MLKKLTIKNFKAIQDMTIEFTPLTVLIGGNACGKSTVLQALDFLRSAAARDIPEYLRERGWNFEELKSKLNNGQNKPIEMVGVFVFSANNSIKTLKWYFSADKNKDHWIIREKIFDVSNENNPVMLRSYGNKEEKTVPDFLGTIYFQSSSLKYVLLDSKEDNFELLLLKKYLSLSMYYGLLSPEEIRKDRNSIPVDDIGLRGENTKPFIHHLKQEDKNKLDALVSEYAGFELEIKTFDTGVGILLYMSAIYNDASISIDAWHISDGLLRLIAFVAISLEKRNQILNGIDKAFILSEDKIRGIFSSLDKLSNGLLMLDEIENGINPYLTEKVIELFRTVIENTSRQVIVTTHSPIILNDVNPNEIRLLWKDSLGSVHCRELFSIAELQDSLDFLNPGDAWMNIREVELLAKAASDTEVQK